MSVQISVRLPDDVAKRVLASGNQSAFVVEAVREKLEREDQIAIEASLACLASAEENDISDFAEAQRKVMARGD